MSSDPDDECVQQLELLRRAHARQHVVVDLEPPPRRVTQIEVAVGFYDLAPVLETWKSVVRAWEWERVK